MGKAESRRRIAKSERQKAEIENLDAVARFGWGKQKPELNAPALMVCGRAKLAANPATQQGSEAQNSGAEEHQAGGLRNRAFRELVRQQRKGRLSARASLNLNALSDIDFLYSRETCAVKQLASHTAVEHAQRDFLSAGAAWQHGSQTSSLADQYCASPSPAGTSNGKAEVGDRRCAIRSVLDDGSL